MWVIGYGGGQTLQVSFGTQNDLVVHVQTTSGDESPTHQRACCEHREDMSLRPEDRRTPPVRVKCDEGETVGDLKKLIATQTGTNSKKIQLMKWYLELLYCQMLR